MHTQSLPTAGDFGGQCLIGECGFDAELLLPSSTYHGLQKFGSFIFGSWRDGDGNLRRAIRAVFAESSPVRHLFVAAPGGQLQSVEHAEHQLWSGTTAVQQARSSVLFRSIGAGPGEAFTFEHQAEACHWMDAELLDVAGRLVGPAVQWFNTWAGGACLAVTAKYRTSGTFLGAPVQGFVGHEIHYFPTGANWIASPYGQGREFCWQHVANEYDDGTLVQASFAYGADGWGFAMLHDEAGTFHAATDVRATATVRPNGFPETVNYHFLNQSWTWRIDPQGERPVLMPGVPIGADGTCQRDDDQRMVRYSLGNSDWWTDGRAQPIISG
ncbi:hypothetical protein [Mycobacterium conspicuum]|uniref:Uncharacterized protein n=1 Tax=Mycobacterium conspicuum TaxID=44010 RepID=A0A1X1TN47_9MYCO|nr:hypothetical protein [Mycobacterium conspicuum]ORV45898.1 hypothetical protein AWC00_05560 [Mycobacterium conspicuum]BBZ38843.1 hypothetical protein MCNS_19060 [Mycobacterium conspicuum]